MTQAQRDRENLLKRERRRRMTPEQKELVREYQRAYMEKLSPEKRETYKAKLREYKKNLPSPAKDRRNEMERKRVAAKPLEWKQAKLAKDLERNQTPEGAKRVREKSRVWKRNHPETGRANCQTRRARRKGSSGQYTAQEWIELVKRYGNRCLRCARQEPEIKLTVDHVVPLSEGGVNDISNIQPLCYSCNSSKCNKTIDFRSQYAA